jgi:membrane associated rhomboid family serine protease
MAERTLYENSSRVALENHSKSFSLNEKEIKVRVERTIVLLAVATLFLCALSFSTWLQQKPSLLVFLLLFSIVGFFSWLIRYSLSKLKLEVSFVSGKLKFPYYYFWLSEVPLGRIFSSEELADKGGVEAIIVGLDSGVSIYFEKAVFANKAQFSEFSEFLSMLSQENSVSYSDRKIDIVDGDSSHRNIQLLVIFIWISMYFLLSSDRTQDFYLLLEAGALSRRAILEGEIYRVFSSFFLHSSFGHVAANVLVFSALSQPILRLVDVSRYLNILFISSLSASFATLLAHPCDLVVGASGGVFGLFGAFLAVRMARKLPGSISFVSDTYILVLVGFELLSGALNERVDIYSHIGGFIAGFLILRFFLAQGSVQTIYQSSIGEKFLSIALLALFSGGFALFFSQLYFGFL